MLGIQADERRTNLLTEHYPALYFHLTRQFLESDLDSYWAVCLYSVPPE
jgi:hypothetical protein